MSMCTFILNDINDIERDRVNHPDRPLPQGLLSARTAATVYFILFVSSLFSVREFVPVEAQFMYLCAFLLAVNYSTIVNNVPVLKNIYVAVVVTAPLLIVNEMLEERLIPPSTALAVFLFILGREILMDIQDQKGDGQTFAKVFGARPSEVIAFLFQGGGIVALAVSTTTLAELACLSMIVLVALVVALLWRQPTQRSAAVHLMKAQLVIALAFLV